MKRFVAFASLCAAFLCAASPSHASRKLYIDNQTGWESSYVYLHNDPVSLWPMGKWPGKAPAYTETVEGTRYEVYEIPDEADDKTVWIVFNDNDGHSIPDTRLDLVSDLYLKATQTYVVEINPFYSPDNNEFTRKLQSLGGISEDLSDEEKIKLGEPLMAYVNLTGFGRMPQLKTDAYQGWLEFYDGEGRYFKKRILAGAQGSSSLGFPKKNIKIDFCEDEWIGNDTPDITFGDWVKQDGFHLKAYYIDLLRGLGTVSYKIFDDIIADRGDMKHPWQRAGVADADAKARCHPEGFPVAVYLNGDFYGIFAWQIKKHRRNMGMDKDNPMHIHLDGTIFFFYDNLDWTMFEIRNPKKLYCQDGRKYDGDNPAEPMGVDSPFYDPANADHVVSAKVKKAIIELTGYCRHLSRMRDRGSSEQIIRNMFERYFDLQGLIDYTVFSAVINNTDGWYKNWQFITYDGIKWYIEPYDLDMTFGNIVSGHYRMPPEYITVDKDPYQRFVIPSGPAEFLHQYYAGELDRRYAELRDKGVITPEKINARIRDWHQRVGREYYDMEFGVWNETCCVRDMIMDPNWVRVDDWTGFNSLPDWNNHRTYKQGDRVKCDMMVFEAASINRNRFPYSQIGFHDSLDDICDWVVRRIDLQDFYMNYDLSKDPSQSGIRDIADRNDISAIAIHDVCGSRLKELRPGINIVTYSDGHSEKIMVK